MDRLVLQIAPVLSQSVGAKDGKGLTFDFGNCAGFSDACITELHAVIADFRKGNGPAIRKVCARFVELCRKLGLLTKASVAIDGSKFKAVNARDKNFTEAKMRRRLERLDESIARYLSQLETADRQGEAVPEAKVARLKRVMAIMGVSGLAAAGWALRSLNSGFIRSSFRNHFPDL